MCADMRGEKLFRRRRIYGHTNAEGSGLKNPPKEGLHIRGWEIRSWAEVGVRKSKWRVVPITIGAEQGERRRKRIIKVEEENARVNTSSSGKGIRAISQEPTTTDSGGGEDPGCKKRWIKRVGERPRYGI